MHQFIRTGAILVGIFFALLTGGCSNLVKGKHSSDNNIHMSPVDERTESERLQRCSAELEAQKTVNRAQYDKQRAEFDQLMSGAAQYAAVRGRVDGVTQDTVDAMYRFRVNLLCASINQAVLTNLAERGEREVSSK